MTDEIAAEATVLSVDKRGRLLTLQRADGSRVTVAAGPQVRNFDQIAAGDRVNARYSLSLSARRLAPGEPDTPSAAGIAAGRSELGQAPAGGIGVGMTLTVVVKSVDLAQSTVVFTAPDGALHVVEAERDEGRRFIAGLKAGDRVELVFGETLAISVNPSDAR